MKYAIILLTHTMCKNVKTENEIRLEHQHRQDSLALLKVNGHNLKLQKILNSCIYCVDVE